MKWCTTVVHDFIVQGEEMMASYQTAVSPWLFKPGAGPRGEVSSTRYVGITRWLLAKWIPIPHDPALGLKSPGLNESRSKCVGLLSRRVVDLHDEIVHHGMA
jgi:hypothetical protein